jgi:inositol transport system substrate-binding protein
MEIRHASAVALCTIGVLLFAGCASSPAGSGESGAGDDTFTIGAVFYDEASPNTAPIREAMKEVAGEAGVAVITTDSKSDTAKERADVEDLITRGVDAIVMQPIDGEASAGAAELINEAGIPLFTVNTGFPEESDIEIVSHIGQNEIEAGKMQAEYLNEMLPDGGRIVFIAGTVGASWTDRRTDGYKAAINDNIEIVAEYAADCSRDKSARNMEDVLQRFPSGEIDGAYASCDEIAIGATLAIAEAGRKDDFQAFVSVDGDPAGFEAVDEGILTATVAQDFRGQGRESATAAIAYLQGRDVEPVIETPAILVTEENVADYLQ